MTSYDKQLIKKKRILNYHLLSYHTMAPIHNWVAANARAVCGVPKKKKLLQERRGRDGEFGCISVEWQSIIGTQETFYSGIF